MVVAAPALAQLPTPFVNVRCEELAGASVTNSGSAGGVGTIDSGLASSAAGLPALTNNVPSGPFAPGGNYYALNFGVSAGHGPYAGKALDFPDSVRASTVGLTQFTLTGWINVTDGSIGGGGNRIFSTWPQNVNGVTANRLTGVDLVIESNGRLRLGVNQAPDYPTPPSGPYSSAGRVTVSATADPTNWLFFAVTYDASQAGSEVTYYFGRADAAAALDLSASYARGMVTNCTVPVTLTLGNFMDTPPLTSARDSTSNSRAFRGLMDEVRFFGVALTPAQIQEVQTTGGAITDFPAGFAAEPVSLTVLENQPASFSVVVTGTPPLHVQWQRNSEDIAGANALNHLIPAASMADDGAAFRAIVTNAFGRTTSSNAVLKVIRDETAPTVLAVTPGRSARNLTNLTVKFSEPVEAGSAQEPGNYMLNGGSLTTYGATLQPDQTTVLLTVEPLTPEAPHTLTISGVTDRAGLPNVMNETNWVFSGPPTRLPPVVAVRFEEGAGSSAANSGLAGGALALSASAPAWANNTPVGLGSASSVDFGTATGNYYVESPTNFPQLAGLPKFTLAGWVNNRSAVEGGGGNRIVAWNSPNGDGADLVYHADGSLQLGINQWPDDVPARSSAGKITTDANAGAENWRFFAVTYDSTLSSDQVKFFFGSSAEDATLDVATTYARGAVGSNIRPLVIGHFNNISRASANLWDRMFRGLIDEVQVFDDALSLEEIVAVQRPGGAASPVGFTLEPVSQTVLEGQPVTLSVVVTGAPPLALQWQRNSNDIAGATAATYSLPAVSMADNGAAFRVVASNALGQAASSNAILTVIRDDVPPTVVAVVPARTARNLTNLTVRFSEPVEAGSAQEPGNFVLSGGLTTYTAALQPDLVSVLLTIDPLTPDATYVLTVSGISDLAGTPNAMSETNWTFTGPPSLLPPAIAILFEEATGLSSTNSGTLGGSAAFVQQAGFPVFSTRIPTGAFAPASTTASVDFGAIAQGEGGRSIDLAGGTYGSQVGPMSAFTLAGWVNCRDLQEGPGGNRILCAHDFNNDPGFDLVQLANGALRLGVNSWPDWPLATVGPLSSPGKITADVNAGSNNWVFFAVTYDGAVESDNVKYYFGSPSQAASFDVAATYPRGGFTSSGNFTVGNLTSADGQRNATGGNSRVFRGLIDNVQVFDEALSLEQLQQVQIAAPESPTLAMVRENDQVVISWESTANFQLQYRDEVAQGTWERETTAPEVNGARKTVRVPATGPNRFYRLQSQ